MTTRLDRLFLLLETGSTPLIRRSAAEQLGEVQKLHPHELNNLLSKVHKYLRSLNWDTRIAAGQAVEAIARNVPQWNPNGVPKEEGILKETNQSPGTVLFSHFDIDKVLLHGSSLLGSEGLEYDTEESSIELNDKEHLIKQRQLLNKRLGLDMASTLGIETDSIFNDDDLTQTKTETSSIDNDKKSVGELVKQQLMDVTSGMSARERNKARRKAKTLAKQRSKETSQTDACSSDSEPAMKKVKLNINHKDKSVEEDRLVIDVNVMEDCEEWPFESFCEVLMNDLFHNAWEIRHGAATGLREAIKLHGCGAGKATDTPVDQMVNMNQTWLCDVALRLLCVLALDRFGDFVADEVVAPVRETCAQTLGVVIRLLDSDGVHSVVKALLALLSQKQWEVRHGGLLGLKYLLAVKKDMTDELLPNVLPSIFDGLQDIDDDVRAVAATALVPVCDELVKLQPAEIPRIISTLWEIMLDLDDLTASTNSIMALLSKLLCYPQGEASTRSSDHSLTELAPRLWPFLRHNIASVRKSALQTLHSLLTLRDPQNQPCSWLSPLLSDALRHIFQRSLLECQSDILDILEKVWSEMLEQVPADLTTKASVPWLGVWFCLLMQPANVPFDQSYFLEAKHRVRDQQSVKNSHRHTTDSSIKSTGNDVITKVQKDYIGGFDCYSGQSDQDVCVTRARMKGAKLLGKLCKCITSFEWNNPQEEKPIDFLSKLMIFHLMSNSALQRFVVAQIIYMWGCEIVECSCPDNLKNRLHACLGESIYFDEITVSFTRMQTECHDFLAGLKQEGLAVDELFPPGAILTLEQAYSLTSTAFEVLKTSLKAKSVQTFEERRAQLQVCVSQTVQEQQTYSIRVQSSLAMATVMQSILPEKLNPVIRPLMDCIKKEENLNIQLCSARCLAKLLQMCLVRNPNPSDKVIKNLCTFLCSDPTTTPSVGLSFKKDSDDPNSEASYNQHAGILTLTNQQKTPEKNKHWQHSVGNSYMDNVSGDNLSDMNESQKQRTIQRMGAGCALGTLTSLFQEKLPEQVPALWSTITSCLKSERVKEANNGDLSEIETQEIVNNLQVIEVVAEHLHPVLLSQALEQLPSLGEYLQNRYTCVRHLASRVLGTLACLDSLNVMTYVIEVILPYLGASDDLTRRQGACEALANIIDRLGMNIVPYIVLLVVPTLGRMSDQNEAVRLMATHCFATLIRLLPLEAGIPDPPNMKSSLVKLKEQERKFLEQLLDSSKLEGYEISIPLKENLRKYQQDGVNWLAFLNKYKLHGILCDDMGLGKTLQSICILSCDHEKRDEEYKVTGNPDCAPLPSIVVCPPTLTGHWVYEIEKFVSSQFLNPLHYTGPPGERSRLQKRVKKHNLVVASYDIVRNDIDFFSSLHWNYCILDEGHVIKNGKTKLSKAVKQLSCNHRLILSGTPIQNNVLDLWSLFDFLMPGFLGTEKQFQARYGKPILQSRDAKSTSKEQEAGALAMESLHRQVLPFILRRLKEDVLQDLPPKIMQDYYCDLSPLQVKLYEDFTRSHARKNVDKGVRFLDESPEAKSSASPVKKSNQGATHIFQALQYLRKVCNHPALVLSTQHPKYEEIVEQLAVQQSSLQDIQHAPKLTALKQLLHDCGIGVPIDPKDTPVVNQHRVLLFCQLKSMLNIVENDLLKIHMPNVTYLRLDGSIPAGSRHSIVNRFNNDPSIDLLLLTTHVGGLGLNLTGADTVIFVEHDWNPMKDLQAMDRAHRIGQKKVVNVYRLITRGTLEEKIMGLQKFKMTIANTVISQDNSTLQSMGTDQLLELFILGEDGTNNKEKEGNESTSKRQSLHSILDNLGELWDEKQYESEYNLNSFLESLGT